MVLPAPPDGVAEPQADGPASTAPKSAAEEKANEKKAERRIVITTIQTTDTGTVSSTTTAVPAQAHGAAGFLFVQGPHTSSRIPIPGTGVKDAITRFRTRLLLGSLGIVAVGLLAAAFVAHRVTRPLVELSRAARKLGEGGFGAQVDGARGGEVGEAIAAFNQMSSRLEALEREALALKEREHLGEMGDVARGMAHALRNPLHAVGLSVDELASRLPDDPEAASMAASARRQIARRRRDDPLLPRPRGGRRLRGGGRRAVPRRGGRPLGAPGSAGPRACGRRPGGADGRASSRSPPSCRAALHALVVNAVEASPDGAEVLVRVEARDGGVRA